MKNVSLFARREIIAHREIVTGVTVTSPAYKVVDGAGHKEWVADVMIGPPDRADAINVVRNVPIAPYAKQLVSGLRVPVTMERSRQGKYTIIGRAKMLPAGAQTPDGSILEPTYHEITYNLAELGLLFIRDLDWTPEKWGDKATWGEVGKPWKSWTATDAFGFPVVGPGIDTELIDPAIASKPKTVTTTRHTLITLLGWGSGTDGLKWGTDPWGAELQKPLELTT